MLPVNGVLLVWHGITIQLSSKCLTIARQMICVAWQVIVKHLDCVAVSCGYYTWFAAILVMDYTTSTKSTLAVKLSVSVIIYPWWTATDSMSQQAHAKPVPRKLTDSFNTSRWQLRDGVGGVVSRFAMNVEHFCHTFQC